MYFDMNFHLCFTEKPSICAPDAPKWGHIGVPATFLSVSWSPCLSLWAVLRTSGHPFGAVPEPLGTIFVNLGAPMAYKFL